MGRISHLWPLFFSSTNLLHTAPRALATLPAMDELWYFCYRQSAAWWGRGRRSLLFRKARRNRQGEWPIAIRSDPFSMPLPGPVGGARDTEHGWKDHPASKAAILAYGPVEEA